MNMQSIKRAIRKSNAATIMNTHKGAILVVSLAPSELCVLRRILNEEITNEDTEVK
jgi:hypothetical protein